MSNRRSGFTLVEMVLVILILSVFMSIGFGRVSALRADMALRGSVDQFVASHNLARTVAIRSHRRAQLRIDSVAYWVQVDTTVDGSGVLDTIGVVVQYSELGVRLSSNRSVLCFDPRGLPTTAGSCDDTQAGWFAFRTDQEADTLRRTSIGKILP